MLTLLAPVLSKMSESAGKAQDTNAIIGNTAAENRPGMVTKNLSNSRVASMMSGYTKPQLNWGGPGSVVRGQQPTITGGFGPDSAETSELEKQVQKDALAQATSNYGIKDPSASSVGSDILGGVSSATGILGALKGLAGGGGRSSGSGGANPSSGPGASGTFGRGPSVSNPGGNLGNGPSNVNTPFGISNQGGPSDITAIGPEAIEMLRRMGLNVGGSATEPGAPAESSAATAGYI